MNEQQFIKQLQKRAYEQQLMVQKTHSSMMTKLLIKWLGVHPWRTFIPAGIILTLLFRLLFGHAYIEFILWLFGKI